MRMNNLGVSGSSGRSLVSWAALVLPLGLAACSGADVGEEATGAAGELATDQLGASADAYGYMPASRIIDLRPPTALAVRNSSALELGPTNDGWQITALTVADAPQLALPVWSALRQLHAACPRPVRKAR